MKNKININNQHGNFHIGGNFNIGSRAQGPASAGEERTAAEPRPESPLVDTERSTVRKMLRVSLRRDAEFDAFVLDCFSDIYRQFATSMERDRKTNLLLESRDPAEVLRRLSQWCASK